MMEVDNLVSLLVSDKFAFVQPDAQKFSLLTNILNKRLEDGQGECFLELGIGDGQSPGLLPEDLNHSVNTTERLAETLKVKLIHLRDRAVSGSALEIQSRIENNGPACGSTSSESTSISLSVPSYLGHNESAEGCMQLQNSSYQPSPDCSAPTPSTDISSVTGPVVREYLLRKETPADDFVDVRVAVVGNVDAGKSTLLGVLTHGELDNGRGQARLRLLRHKHEAESGRTSSVSNDILGFDTTGQVVNRPLHGQLDWLNICKASAKVITFIDLAGHERYLKTTIFGMTGHAPDYAMFMVGANAGVIGMAKEHLGLALALGVPVFVVVTKIDMCPSNVFQETMTLLFRILKSPGCRKIPLLISSKDDVICSATNFTSERMCPVFSVSNVTGENLDLLKMFLNLLTPRSQPRLTDPAHFQVDDIFSVPGVGNVVSGTCLSGVIRLNDTLLLGPDPMGQFNPVPIKSIHRKRMPVTYVRGGQTASFALKKLRRNQLRKGIVLLSPELKPRACIEFMAEVLILHHPTTIWVGYQAMVHAGPVRQTATILALSGQERLRTGDKDLVHFRFMKYPEYLYPGLRLIFREGKTKAVGTVKETIPLADPAPQNLRNRALRKLTPQISSKTTTPTRPPVAMPLSDIPGACAGETAGTVYDSVDQKLLDPHRPAYSKQRKHYKSHKDTTLKHSYNIPQDPPSSN
ncbi:hypothetical protein CRM22_002955 [Opisthorchis felineus]|uniref:Tr-type G domain-containing protein n=1 Tax=Opisthorchis felineus TaxID=147828 RepID=A0A4S2M442_OPIFE|nr:hypothetical protein CRM22_002955 [Opisthorchis felineus]